MTRNLSGLERAARFVLGLIFLFSAFALFDHPITKIFFIIFGLGAIVEAVTAVCPLLTRWAAGSDGSRSRIAELALLWIQMVFAFVWWSSGWGKWTDPEFINNMPGIVSRFASQNPFSWAANLLTGPIAAQAELFGNLVRLGEVAAAVGLLVSGALFIYTRSVGLKRGAIIIAVVSLLIFIVMNVAFYFFAGWMNPATHSLNVVMFWIQAALLYFWLSRWLSIKT